MTTLLGKTNMGRLRGSLTVAGAFALVFGDQAPVRLVAYDGSSAGAPDALYRVQLRSRRGLELPDDVAELTGAGPRIPSGRRRHRPSGRGRPYEALKFFEDGLQPHRPTVSEILELTRFLAHHLPRVPELPKEETPGSLRRMTHGLTHGRARDAEAIHHHYDVSNRFYELLLGPSMAYTCAVYPTADASLETAQDEKFDLVCRKLGLQPGMRLLDVGCGWGGMVRHAVTHYGVTAIGVTLSRSRRRGGRTDGARGPGRPRRHPARRLPRRDRERLRRGVLDRAHRAHRRVELPRLLPVPAQPAPRRGRLLNHCITRPDNQHPGIPSRGFINRYVFPDGAITGSGTIVEAMEDQGLEVRHQENLREHYAMTTRDWCRNLSDNWDAAVAEAGLGVARVWGLYLAGSRLSFERNRIQLHQVLASGPPRTAVPVSGCDRPGPAEPLQARGLRGRGPASSTTAREP